MARSARMVLAVVGVLVALAALAWIALRPSRVGVGPAPIAWDHEACARCRMLIGDPAYAAQIQTEDGRVLDFDDPGCLLLYEAEHEPRESAVWFHAEPGDAWIPRERVGFVPTQHPTPMGYGLAAVERASRADALDPPAALALVRARETVRRRD